MLVSRFRARSTFKFTCTLLLKSWARCSQDLKTPRPKNADFCCVYVQRYVFGDPTLVTFLCLSLWLSFLLISIIAQRYPSSFSFGICLSKEPGQRAKNAKRPKIETSGSPPHVILHTYHQLYQRRFMSFYQRRLYAFSQFLKKLRCCEILNKGSFRILKKKFGGDGHRSHYLAHAKRALYHLSYTPD